MGIFRKRKEYNNRFCKKDPDYLTVCEIVNSIKPGFDKRLKPSTHLIVLGFNSMDYISLILKVGEIVKKEISEISERIEISSILTIKDVVLMLKSLK